MNETNHINQNPMKRSRYNFQIETDNVEGLNGEESKEMMNIWHKKY
jgi:hypothetical protein